MMSLARALGGPAMMQGTLLGNRYELRGELGAGGFGTVWLAHDLRLRRDVAVKLLHVEGADVPRFEREGLALAQLSHPNIVTVYDVGTEAATAYMVMEFIRGNSLADTVEHSPGGQPVAWVLQVAAQILTG